MLVKPLSEYKTEDGYYADDKGCHYEDAIDLIQTGILGFCGCGRPEDNLLFILGGLELIDEVHQRKAMPAEEFRQWSQDHQERCVKFFGNENAMQFFHYWTDNQGLTEHGGSIPGWLDDSGEQLLATLREWKNLQEGTDDA